MEVTLKNGAGGDIAKIDSNLRLHTAAVSEEEKDHACDFGQKFNINTGDITITNATKLTTFYGKNTGDDDLIITAFIYNLGNTASGTGDVLIEVLRNPTVGAIITNTNDVAVGPTDLANQNFGSTETLTGAFYKGAVGEAVVSASDGVTVSTRSASRTGRFVIDLGNMTIPKGSSFAINYTPPASNTTQICQFAAAGFVRTDKVADPV